VNLCETSKKRVMKVSVSKSGTASAPGMVENKLPTLTTPTAQPAQTQLRRKAIFAFAMAVFLTGFVGYLSWRTEQNASEEGDWVSHTREVSTILEAALRHLLDAETGARGFAATGSNAFLEPYENGKRAVAQDLHALRHLIVDPDQTRRLDLLVEQVTLEVTSVDRVVAGRQLAGRVPSVALFEEGKRAMDQVRITVAQMEAAQEALLATRTARARSASRLAGFVIASGSLLGMTFLVLAGWSVIKGVYEGADARAQVTALAAVVSSDDAIISKTLDGTITTWNHGAENMFGYSAPEAIGRPIVMLVPPDRINEERDILVQVRLGETVRHLETIRVRKDGTQIEVSATISPIRDGSGEIVGASKVAREVTELKLKEEALQASEERFHAMVNGIPQLAWMAEGDGSIFWYNERWYEYTGTTPDQMTGWGWQSVHDPNVLPTVLEKWKAAIVAGEPFEMEFPLRGADGILRAFLTRVLPLKDPAGRVGRWFGTNTNIAERKRAEETLAAQAEELLHSQHTLEAQTRLLTSVLDSMEEGLIAADEHGKFLIWNPAAEKIVGLGAADVPPEDWSAYYGAYLPDRITPFPIEQNPLLRAIRGDVSTAEMFFSRPELKRYFWIESRGAPLRDQNGIVRGGVIAFRDITKQKADEEEIRKLNQDLENRIAERTAQLVTVNHDLEAFSHSISHDLRAPLRHISGFSTILCQDFGGAIPREARDYLQRITDGAYRMTLMVENLLNLSKLGRKSLNLCVTDLNAVVEEVILVLKPELDGRDVEWRIARLPAIECDRVLMGQVFQNLLSNAIKYSGHRNSARIEIDSILEPGKAPVIFVRDNGAGFSMQNADKLFVVFQRLHAAKEFEGTGVGLSTVHRIIQKHGGSIWAESEPDRGATFYFTVEGKEQMRASPNEPPPNNMAEMARLPNNED
jgi:hypothetical protein